jgi:hypothetical protein
MKRIDNVGNRREPAKNSSVSLDKGMVNPESWRIAPAGFGSFIYGSNRLFAVQKKRQATKSVARLDNPRQTNVSAKEQL